MMIRSTRTYSILEVSAEAYAEIRAALAAAGYDHAFQNDGDKIEVIDMAGIALRRKPEPIVCVIADHA